MLIGIDASRSQTKEKTGTENYSYELISNLAQIDSKNSYRLYLKDSNYSLKLPPNFQTKAIPLPRLWTQVGLAGECFFAPPDILFIPSHTLPIFRRPGLKTIVTIHDLGAEFLPSYHQFPQKLYLNKSTKYAVAQATHLIAVSESTKKDLVEKLVADPGKISVVYEGIEAEKFKIQNPKSKIEEIRKKYLIPGQYLLFVGTIQPRKNLVRLIEAFAKILRYKDTKILSEKTKKPPNISISQYLNISLVLAGKRGWLAEEIYQAPKKLGIEDKVRFLDYVKDEDLPALYKGALAFVFPSLYEGFGLPVLEAMAAGVPVICSQTSSLPEVAGEAAVYVNPKSTEDIAEGMMTITKNEKLKMKNVELGYKQVQKFSWQKCAKETLKVFEKVYGK